ncbi:MAG: GAF domain-containing sensor histidine kinase [Anaerolineae bacterium]
MERTVELEQILARLLEAATQVLQADAAVVRLLNDRGQELTTAVTIGLTDHPGAAEPVALDKSPVDREVLAGRTVIVDQIQDDVRAASLAQEYCSALCVPLSREGDPLGTLHIYATGTHCFAESHSELLGPLVDLAAEAVAGHRAYTKLQEQEASQSRFIRVATHELRSPIAVAQSLLRNVVKGYAGELTEAQRDVFARINRRLDFMETLVNDLLDLAAGKSPELGEDAQAVAVNASAGRAVLLVQPRAEEKDIELSLDPCCEELVVQASEEGLDRIFVNLVDNAVKYTPAGGAVRVALRRRDEEIQVTVSDNGIGIPGEALAHLYEEFYRARNAKKVDAVGTGLGLAIVKDLVDRYEGRILVESELGQGTTFTVVFPVLREDARVSKSGAKTMIAHR